MNQIKMEDDGLSPRDHHHTVVWVKTEDGDDPSHNDHKESSDLVRVNEGEGPSLWNCSGPIAWVKVEVEDELSAQDHGVERNHLKEEESEEQSAMNHQHFIIKQVKLEIEEDTSGTETHTQRNHSRLEDEERPCAREQQCPLEGQIIESSVEDIDMADINGGRARKGSGQKKPAFTERELQALADAVVPVQRRLLGAEYHTTTSAERDKLWDAILARVNAVARVHRDRDDVLKRWNDLKWLVKIIYAEAVQRERETGRDGPSTIQWLPWEQKVLSTVNTTSIYGVEPEHPSISGKLQRRRTIRLRPLRGHGNSLETPVTTSAEALLSPAVCTFPLSHDVLNSTIAICRMNAMHDMAPFANTPPLPSASRVPIDNAAYTTLATVGACVNAPLVNLQVTNHPATSANNTNDVQVEETGPMYGMQGLSDSCPSSWEETPDSSEHGTPVSADPMVEMLIGQRSLIKSSERLVSAQETMRNRMKRQQMLINSMLKQQSVNHTEQMKTLGVLTKAIQDLTAVAHSLVGAVNNLVVSKSAPHQAVPVTPMMSNTSSDVSSLPPRSPSPERGPALQRNLRDNMGVSQEAPIPLKRRRM